jgi:dTDP-4-dehydrorhamnose 3,5-epimerase
LIEGVVVKQPIKHEDERGFFVELLKCGEDSFHDVLQTSYSETRPGVIKAFHVHDYWEVWCVIKGRAQIVLHDLRPGTTTTGQTDVIIAGEDDMKVVAIPGGVAHGYMPLGNQPMGILYHASEAYVPGNGAIRSLPYDDPTINFIWGKPRE